WPYRATRRGLPRRARRSVGGSGRLPRPLGRVARLQLGRSPRARGAPGGALRPARGGPRAPPHPRPPAGGYPRPRPPPRPPGTAGAGGPGRLAPVPDGLAQRRTLEPAHGPGHLRTTRLGPGTRAEVVPEPRPLRPLRRGDGRDVRADADRAGGA